MLELLANLKHAGGMTAFLLLMSSVWAITIGASLQKEVLRNPDIRNCYARSESAHKKGRVVLTLDVDRLGKVTGIKADAARSTLKDANLQKCLVETTRSLILPLNSKARNKKNSLPLSFPPPP